LILSEIIGLPEGALQQRSGDRIYVFFPIYFYDKSAKKGLRGKQKRRYIGTVVDGVFVPNKFYKDNPNYSRTQMRNDVKTLRNPWEQVYSIVDLSHSLEEGMPVFPGDPAPSLKRLRDFSRDGYRLTQLTAGMHLGTHVDAPSHLIDKGAPISAYGCEQFVGSAVVADCTGLAPGSEIPASVLEAHSGILDKIDFVILRTGWDAHWNTETYLRHPVPSAELCHALSALHLKGVGLDTCSPDHADSAQLPRHRTLLNQGESVIIENLCNLQALPAGPFTFICLPLKLIDAEASVTRAVAIISDVD
jgi:kynurenine formamidase